VRLVFKSWRTAHLVSVPTRPAFYKLSLRVFLAVLSWSLRLIEVISTWSHDERMISSIIRRFVNDIKVEDRWARSLWRHTWTKPQNFIWDSNNPPNFEIITLPLEWISANILIWTEAPFHLTGNTRVARTLTSQGRPIME